MLAQLKLENSASSFQVVPGCSDSPMNLFVLWAEAVEAEAYLLWASKIGVYLALKTSAVF